MELARRGYVVLAQDMPSHGESDNVNNVGLVTSGLYQSVKVLADMPYVDKSRIGITGHSMGGMSCNAAIELDNQAEEQLISAVLLNCADATYVDADGAGRIPGLSTGGCDSAAPEQIVGSIHGGLRAETTVDRPINSRLPGSVLSHDAG